ncbi:hypothetical protein [Lentibacillus cibarius]|uniref:Uncharacterized protein n=1 Tax=Lentibacillus cibarius TaxID=2583219 RepID=A0A5S3QL22_9BACI|nr:hypothetical protein [Lentibacillus cibarius]TMN22437.1 hypothetical protein FFL34_10170 [Lentibacillus cibarius]
MKQNIQKMLSAIPMAFMFFAFYIGVSVEKALNFGVFGIGWIWIMAGELIHNIRWFLALTVTYYVVKYLVIELISKLKKTH